MKKYFRLSILALSVFSLSSCLKDDATTLDPTASPTVVEFTNVSDIASPQGAKYPLYVTSVDLVPAASVPVTINLTGANAADTDVSIALTQVTGTGTGTPIGVYNAEHNSDVVYEELPTAVHDFTARTVVIPKGSRMVTFPINVKPQLFDLSKSYAIALKIVSTTSGGISSNFGTILVSIGPKNKFDGAYNYKTTAGTSLQPNLNRNAVGLITTGANTLKTNLLNTYSNIIVYSIDPATNQVTVVSVTPSIGTPVTDPVSNYNPTTKVMYVKWIAGTRSFEETYTYQGSR